MNIFEWFLAIMVFAGVLTSIPKLGTTPSEKENLEVLSGGILILTIIIGLSFLLFDFFTVSEEEQQEQAERAAEQAENRQRGFHCLSSWDGSHRDVVRQVEAMLQDPASFEHDETRVSPVSTNGTHNLVMEFRARTIFGGMARYTATATYGQNCRIINGPEINLF